MLLLSVGAVAFVCPRLTSTATEPLVAPSAQQRRRTQTPSRTSSQPQRASYTEFSHRVAAHRKACDSCHKFPSANWKEVRKGDEAFPDITEYPQHASCLECHRQQFFSGARPNICSVCHVNVTPRGGARHPFPNPSESYDASPRGQTAVSDFQIYFPHDKHEGVVAARTEALEVERSARFVRASLVSFTLPSHRQESDDSSCSVCHQTYQPQGDEEEEFATPRPKDLPEEAFWLKRGTFKTTPTSHAKCFTCHSTDSGLTPASNDCAACHKLLAPGQTLRLAEAHDDFDPKLAASMGIRDRTILEKWSRRDTARFRHEWLPHAALTCNACHNVSALNTLDERRKKVSVLSCGGEGTGCHIESSSEGVLNLAVEKKRADPTFQCTKCHLDNGGRPLPESHVKAVAAAEQKK